MTIYMIFNALSKIPVYSTCDSNFCFTVNIFCLRVIIFISMSSFRRYNKIFCIMYFWPITFYAPMPLKMIIWQLSEITMSFTRDYNFSCCIYIFCFRIVILISMYLSGFFYKCASVIRNFFFNCA